MEHYRVELVFTIQTQSVQEAIGLRTRVFNWLEDNNAVLESSSTQHILFFHYRVVGVDVSTRTPYAWEGAAENEDAAKIASQLGNPDRVAAEVRYFGYSEPAQTTFGVAREREEALGGVVVVS